MSPALAASTALFRERIEAAVEKLIALLDELDGDTDIEDDDPGGGDVNDEGEPYQGWCNPESGPWPDACDIDNEV